jgi:hypothetical protein
MQMSDGGPFPVSQVLAEEYKVLRPNSDFPATGELFDKVHSQETPLTALCISGGGIRSATFALGVIQGLAEDGVLGEFDYLSTVSGGGYIGGWLSSWKQRAGGLGRVIPQLRRDAAPVPGEVPDPIEHLREYNSYLSPKTGLFSVDTWTLAAIVARNILLNWLVFIPVLLFALMLPRLVLSLARLGETRDVFYGASADAYAGMLSIAIPLVGAVLFAVAIYNIMRYLPGVGAENHSEWDFVRHCLIPLLGATLAFVTNDSWFAGGNSTHPGMQSALQIGYLQLAGGVVGSAFAGWLTYLVFCRKSLRERVRLFFPVSGAVLLTAWSAASMAWLLVSVAYPVTSWPLYITVAAPLLLMALLVAGCLFVGFTSLVLKDEDREWLARAGAWVGLFIVGWTSISGLVLLAPAWVTTGLSLVGGPDAKHFALPGWVETVLAAAGALGGGTTAFTGSSAKTKARKEDVVSDTEPPRSALMSLAMKLAAPLFVISLLVGLSILTNWLLSISGVGIYSHYDPAAQAEVFTPCPNCAWWDYQGILEGTRWEAVLGAAMVFVGFGWMMGKFINTNKFSLQGMYRNRLIRAYLGASNNRESANKFTGFAETDNLAMSDLDTALKPFHVVNVTLNLVAGKRLAWQQRKAESFTMSPLHCGSYDLGYRPSRHYGGPEGMSLGTAVAISGAAASPNMGYHSSPVIGFIMTLFNARLGSWLGNPGTAGAKTWRKAGPMSAFGSVVKEAFGLTNNSSAYVYLSDGGHFENLGLYEMVRRRCRYIVVSDGGCDPTFTYGDLGNALRKIRIDLKIPIEFDDRFVKPLREKQKRCAVAHIRYSVADKTGDDGLLLYIKPMIRGNEPPDVASYQCDHQDFPHQSTADQFFDESQTESYRMLGLSTMDEICRGWSREGGIAGLLRHVETAYLGEEGARVATARG